MDDKLLKIARKIKSIEEQLNKITQIKDLEGLLFVNTEITNKYKKSINDVVNTYKDYTSKTQKELSESMKILKKENKDNTIENKNIIKELENKTNKIKEDIKNICVSLDKSIENIQKDILKDIKTQNDEIGLNLKNKDKEISLIKKENKVLKDNLTKLKELFDKLELQKGEAGKSAYEIACELGFKGTVEEWLKSLHGKDGKEIELRGMRAFSDAPKDGKTYGRKNKKWVELSGSGGTTDYEDLDNLPSINNVELKGNKTLEDLGVKNYDNDINDLKQDIKGIVILGEAQGENITLNDSAECRLQDIVVRGNTKQETRSGKNLLKINDIPETTRNGVTYSCKDGILTLNGTATNGLLIDFDDIDLPAGTYYFKSYADNITGSYARYLADVTDAAKNVTNSGGISIDAMHKVHFRFYSNAGVVHNNAKVYAQLEQGSTATDYEQYGAMPSPDYPSDIRNVGDNINEFNWTGISNANIGTFEDGIATLNWSSGFDCFLLSSDSQVLSGLDSTKTYTISFKHKGNKIILKEYQTSGNLVTTGNTNNYTTYSFSITGVTSIKLDINRSDTTGTAYIKEIKVEEGTTLSQYSPYNCGNFDITVTNKNIFNGFRSLGANATYNNGVLDISASGAGAICYSNYFIPSGDRKYYFSYNSSYATARYYIVEYDKNYNQISSTSKTAQTSFTIGSDAVYFAIIWNFASGTTFPLTISNMQLEEGTTATTYIEHQEQSITFPLSQGQVLHKGDYLADDGIHYKRTQVVLDGSENWSTDASLSTVRRFTLDLTDSKLNDGNNNKNSNYFIYSFDYVLDKPHFYISNNGRLYIFASFTQTQDFKTWLSNNPVTVEYELAEEIIVPYTPEQQLAYNQIKNLHTYKNVTHIYSENEISPEFDVEYAKDLEEEMNKKIDDVQIDGTSIKSDGIANIPIASNSSSTGGLIKYGNGIYGIKNISGGVIGIIKPTDAEIEAQSTGWKVLTPAQLSKAVKEGVTNNSITLTDTEKANARDWIGADGDTWEKLVDKTLQADNSTALAYSDYNYEGKFKKIRIQIRGTVDTNNANISFYRANNSSAYQVFGNVARNSDTLYEFVLEGIPFVQPTAIRDNSVELKVYNVASNTWTMLYQGRAPVASAMEDITDLKITSNGNFQTGTRVVVWGLR